MVFDLTEMARRATAAIDAMLKERHRNCYIGAIMASGSVPLAAAPVFIDPELNAPCAALSRLDDQTSRPVELRPRYMHCLIA